MAKLQGQHATSSSSSSIGSSLQNNNIDNNNNNYIATTTTTDNNNNNNNYYFFDFYDVNRCHTQTSGPKASRQLNYDNNNFDNNSFWQFQHNNNARPDRLPRWLGR